MAVNQDRWSPVKGENENKDKVVSIHGVGDCKPFKFEVVRQKDSETKQENLVIHAYYNNEDYGTIVSSISKLQNDIVKLQDIGVVLARQYYAELVQIIKNISMSCR